MVHMADQAISIKEAARRLGVSEQTIRRMIQAREIRSFRVLGQVRIRESEIERIMRGGQEQTEDK